MLSGAFWSLFKDLTMSFFRPKGTQESYVLASSILVARKPIKSKKNRTYEKEQHRLRIRFWSGRNKHSALPLMEVFFQFHDLATAKERLNRIMQYAVQGKTRIREEPSVVFHFHQSLRSFIRAEWCLRKKAGKWIGESVPEHSSPLMQGSLSEEEYRDPVRVFRKAFKEYRLEEFEEFLSDVVYFSLGTFNNLPERDIVGPYLHLIKMLDAAWLVLERKKNKKSLP